MPTRRLQISVSGRQFKPFEEGRCGCANSEDEPLAARARALDELGRSLTPLGV